MTWLIPILVFVHALSVILAFGPTYAYPMVFSVLAEQPAHRGFWSAARMRIHRRLTFPATVVVGLSGALLVLISGWDLSAPAARWLLVSILGYSGMISYSILVLNPMNERLIALGAAAAAAGGPPPSELMALVARTRRDGKVMGWLTIGILFLMVVKPVSPI